MHNLARKSTSTSSRKESVAEPKKLSDYFKDITEDLIKLKLKITSKGLVHNRINDIYELTSAVDLKLQDISEKIKTTQHNTSFTSFITILYFLDIFNNIPKKKEDWDWVSFIYASYLLMYINDLSTIYSRDIEVISTLKGVSQLLNNYLLALELDENVLEGKYNPTYIPHTKSHDGVIFSSSGGVFDVKGFNKTALSAHQTLSKPSVDLDIESPRSSPRKKTIDNNSVPSKFSPTEINAFAQTSKSADSRIMKLDTKWKSDELENLVYGYFINSYYFINTIEEKIKVSIKEKLAVGTIVKATKFLDISNLTNPIQQQYLNQMFYLGNSEQVLKNTIKMIAEVEGAIESFIKKDIEEKVAEKDKDQAIKLLNDFLSKFKKDYDNFKDIYEKKKVELEDAELIEKAKTFSKLNNEEKLNVFGMYIRNLEDLFAKSKSADAHDIRDKNLTKASSIMELFITRIPRGTNQELYVNAIQFMVEVFYKFKKGQDLKLYKSTFKKFYTLLLFGQNINATQNMWVDINFYKLHPDLVKSYLKKFKENTDEDVISMLEQNCTEFKLRSHYDDKEDEIPYILRLENLVIQLREHEFLNSAENVKSIFASEGKIPHFIAQELRPPKLSEKVYKELKKQKVIEPSLSSRLALSVALKNVLFEKRNEKLQIANDTLKTEKESLNKTLLNLNKKLTEVTEENKELKKELNTNISLLEKQTEQIKILNATNKTIAEQLKKSESRNKNLEAENTRILGEMDENKSQVEAYIIEIRKLNLQIVGKDKGYSDLENEILTKNKEIEALKAANINLNTRFQQNKELLDKNKIDNEILIRANDDNANEIRSLNLKYTTLLNRNSTIEKELEELKTKELVLTNNLLIAEEKNKKLENENRELQNQYSIAAAKLVNLEKENQKIVEETEGQKEKFDKFVSALKNQLKIADIKTEMFARPVTSDVYFELIQTKAKKIQENEKKLQNQLEAVNLRIQNMKDSIGKLEEKKENLQSISAEGSEKDFNILADIDLISKQISTQKVLMEEYKSKQQEFNSSHETLIHTNEKNEKEIESLKAKIEEAKAQAKIVEKETQKNYKDWESKLKEINELNMTLVDENTSLLSENEKLNSNLEEVQKENSVTKDAINKLNLLLQEEKEKYAISESHYALKLKELTQKHVSAVENFNAEMDEFKKLNIEMQKAIDLEASSFVEINEELSLKIEELNKKIEAGKASLQKAADLANQSNTELVTTKQELERLKLAQEQMIMQFSKDLDEKNLHLTNTESLKNELANKLSESEATNNTLKLSLAGLTEKIVGKDSEILNLQADLALRTSELNLVKLSKDELERNLASFQMESKRQLKDKDEEILNLSNLNLSQKEKIYTLNLEIAELKQNIEQIKSEKVDLEQRHNELIRKHEQIEVQWIEETSAKETVQSNHKIEIEKLNNKISELNDKLTSHEKSLKSLQDNNEAFTLENNLLNDLLTIKSDELLSTKMLLEQKELALKDEVESKIKLIEAHISALAAVTEKNQALEKDYEILKQQLENSQEETRAAKAETAQIRSQHEQALATNAALGASLAALKSSLLTHEATIGNNQDEIQTLKSNISGLEFNAVELNAEILKQKIQIENLQTLNSKLTFENEGFKEEIERLNKALTEKDEEFKTHCQKLSKLLKIDTSETKIADGPQLKQMMKGIETKLEAYRFAFGQMKLKLKELTQQNGQLLHTNTQLTGQLEKNKADLSHVNSTYATVKARLGAAERSSQPSKGNLVDLRNQLAHIELKKAILEAAVNNDSTALDLLKTRMDEGAERERKLNETIFNLNNENIRKDSEIEKLREQASVKDAEIERLKAQILSVRQEHELKLALLGAKIVALGNDNQELREQLEKEKSAAQMALQQLIEHEEACRLKIEELQRVRLTETKELKDKIVLLESDADSLKANVEQKKKELEFLLEKSNKDFDEYEAKIKEKTNEYDEDLQKHLQLNKKLEQEKIDLSLNNTTLLTAIIRLEGELRDITSAKLSLEQAKDQLTLSLDQLTNANEELTATNAQLVEKIEFSEKLALAKQLQYREIQVSNEELNGKLTSLQKTIEEQSRVHEREIERLQNALIKNDSELKLAAGFISSERKKNTELDARLKLLTIENEHYQSLIINKDHELAQLKDNLGQVNLQLKRLQLGHQELTQEHLQSLETIRVQKQELVNLKENIEGVKEQNSKLNLLIDSLTSSVLRLDFEKNKRTKKCQDLEADLSARIEGEKVLRQEFNAYKDSQEEIINNLTADKTGLQAELRKAREEFEDKKRQMQARLDLSLEEMNQLKTTLKNQEHEIAVLNAKVTQLEQQKAELELKNEEQQFEINHVYKPLNELYEIRTKTQSKLEPLKNDLESQQARVDCLPGYIKSCEAEIIRLEAANEHNTTVVHPLIRKEIVRLEGEITNQNNANRDLYVRIEEYKEKVKGAFLWDIFNTDAWDLEGLNKQYESNETNVKLKWAEKEKYEKDLKAQQNSIVENNIKIEDEKKKKSAYQNELSVLEASILSVTKNKIKFEFQLSILNKIIDSKEKEKDEKEAEIRKLKEGFAREIKQLEDFYSESEGREALLKLGLGQDVENHLLNITELQKRIRDTDAGAEELKNSLSELNRNKNDLEKKLKLAQLSAGLLETYNKFYKLKNEKKLLYEATIVTSQEELKNYFEKIVKNCSSIPGYLVQGHSLNLIKVIDEGVVVYSPHGMDLVSKDEFCNEKFTNSEVYLFAKTRFRNFPNFHKVPIDFDKYTEQKDISLLSQVLWYQAIYQFELKYFAQRLSKLFSLKPNSMQVKFDLNGREESNLFNEIVNSKNIDLFKIFVSLTLSSDSLDIKQKQLFLSSFKSNIIIQNNAAEGISV